MPGRQRRDGGSTGPAADNKTTTENPQGRGGDRGRGRGRLAGPGPAGNHLAGRPLAARRLRQGGMHVRTLANERAGVGNGAAHDMTGWRGGLPLRQVTVMPGGWRGLRGCRSVPAQQGLDRGGDNGRRLSRRRSHGRHDLAKRAHARGACVSAQSRRSRVGCRRNR